MKDELAQALLIKVMKWDENEDLDNRPYIQSIAKYKYDRYNQFFVGMRFVERLALWLKQFLTTEDKKKALKFVKEKLIYISNEEIIHLIKSSYPDKVRNILASKISKQHNIPDYKIKSIVDSSQFKLLKRQSLFLGLSDGAKIDIFRRFNNGILSHEQIYQTYELSTVRTTKMEESLRKDLEILLKREPSDEEVKFKQIFLIDDFSASGTTNIMWNKKEAKFSGKIMSLYSSLKDNKDINKLFNFEHLDIYIFLYICTKQAFEHLSNALNKAFKNFPIIPQVFPLYIIDDKNKIADTDDIIEICQNDNYYDSNILEDEHTKKGGGNVKLGFSNCCLPLILSHNTPNNSISILWAYDNAKFKGLFPRIPRHTTQS